MDVVAALHNDFREVLDERFSFFPSAGKVRLSDRPNKDEDLALDLLEESVDLFLRHADR